MKALRFYAPGDVRLEDVPDPEPGPGEVLVQVEVALTDGTDAKAFHRGHPVLLGPPPSPFGHEFCGIDVATGKRLVAANSGRSFATSEPQSPHASTRTRCPSPAGSGMSPSAGCPASSRTTARTGVS